MCWFDACNGDIYVSSTLIVDGVAIPPQAVERAGAFIVENGTVARDFHSGSRCADFELNGITIRMGRAP